MNKLFTILIILINSLPLSAQNNTRIGLTLSGGGAKGLAHIGILQAIDSAGLNVSYITGTSMGSIMGALYAVGYSGNQIEEITRGIDWGNLFSGKPLMSNVNITEKDEFDSYAVEIPIENGKPKIGTGLIEGQEIWVKFQESFMPVYNIKDFNKFSIPFRCIAADVATGNVVKLDTGEVVSAIRSSMAIPSVFTAIDYKETKLIDGGVIRNFPVRDAVEMGANYTIGVKVAIPLLPAEELLTAFDVLYQIGFYKDADDFPEEVKLCNLLIEPPMKDFNAASFASADTIIAIGKEWGRKYYPQFKHLADSLRKVDPNYKFHSNRLPNVDKVVVDSITVAGLKHTSKKSFLNNLNVHPNDSVDGIDVGHGVRKIFGTKNYKRINYAWEPTSAGHADLKFKVIENPLATLKMALHYNKFSNIAIVTALEIKNLFFDRSKTTVKLNIGENYRILFQQNQTFGKQDNNDLIFSLYYESFKYPVYIDFQQTYLYRNNYFQYDMKAQHTFNLKSALGVGTSYESFQLRPKVFGSISVEAGNSYLNSYLFYNRNTLDRKQFPTKGLKIETKAGYVYAQNPDDVFIQAASLTSTIDTLSFDGYAQLQFKVDKYFMLNNKFSIITQFNGAANFSQDQSYLNFFYVGGLVDYLRNQVTFAGLSEYEVYTNSIAAGLLGVQYHPFKSIYGTLRGNVGLYEFAEENPESWTASDNLLSGYSFTVGYASGIGPIQFSLLYSDQSKTFTGYIDIGFHF